ncbi:MAG: DUF2079 domain-containing protein, partial [Proteobacteria bacterium]|nr:DUF2079 domain-containing protein [Pseudomonadota bacterium]
MTKATARISNFAAWIAAWMFLGGGLTLRSVFLGKGAMLELSQWGLWLTPLMLLILGGDSEWRDLSFVRRLHRLWPYFGRNSFAAFLMISAGCLHFFAMMARHYSFQSEWDLSIYANACAHGLQSSLRNHTSLLADHFEPGLFLLAPACAAMNPVVVLLLAQSIAWSLGSWGIRKLALLAGWSPSL